MLPALESVDWPCGAMLPVICKTRTPDSASQALTRFSNAVVSFSSPLKILICCIGHGPGLGRASVHHDDALNQRQSIFRALLGAGPGENYAAVENGVVLMQINAGSLLRN